MRLFSVGLKLPAGSGLAAKTLLTLGFICCKIPYFKLRLPFVASFRKHQLQKKGTGPCLRTYEFFCPGGLAKGVCRMKQKPQSQSISHNKEKNILAGAFPLYSSPTPAPEGRTSLAQVWKPWENCVERQEPRRWRHSPASV